MDIKRFFQMGWNLIESEDVGTRQHVIAKLGAETGLAIIKTLTDIMDASQKDETTVSRRETNQLGLRNRGFRPCSLEQGGVDVRFR